MRTHLTKRTMSALLAGVALTVGGGGGAAYLATRPSTADPAQGLVPVLYAEAPIPAGTQASVALSKGAVRRQQVKPAELPPSAVVDTAQLAGRVSARAIPAGTVITTDMFPDPQTRIGTLVIPPGRRALALELRPVAGVAGFAGAGDRIDVYGVVAAADSSPPAVRLVLQGIEVLSVNGSGLAPAQGQPGSPNLIFLLAVTPAEAERLVYLNEFAKLYFDLVPDNEGPVRTPGAGPTGVLAV